MKKIYLIPLALLMLIATISSATAVTNVTSCGTLSAADTYILQNNITSTSTNCFVISGSNIIFDGNGYTIDKSTSGETGIQVDYGRTNIEIKNLNIINVDDITGGIYMKGANTGSLIHDNVISGGGVALKMFQTGNFGSYYNNELYGDIELRSWDANTIAYIYNNLINGTVLDTSSSSIAKAKWNTTETTATNIVGGATIGGNYWTANPSCTDTDLNGICNDQYNFTASPNNYLVTDYLPLVIPPPFNPNLTTCGDLNESNVTYFLQNNLVDTNNYCFRIYGDNVILDMQGYQIDKNGGTASIYVDANNAEIKNGTLKDYAGIDTEAGNTNLHVHDMSFSGVTGTCAALDLKSDYNTIHDITMSGSSQETACVFGDHTVFYNVQHNAGNNAFKFYSGADNITLRDSNLFSTLGGEHLFSLYGATNVVIRDNIIKHNTGISNARLFQATSGANTLFYNNNVTYENDQLGSLNAAYIKFNTTETTATNIIGGTKTGGNYWLNSTGGYSTNCVDADVDGLCDNQYNLSLTLFDFLPLTKIKYYPLITSLEPLNNTAVDGAEEFVVGEIEATQEGDNITCYFYVNDALEAQEYYEGLSIGSPENFEFGFDGYPDENITWYVNCSTQEGTSTVTGTFNTQVQVFMGYLNIEAPTEDETISPGDTFEALAEDTLGYGGSDVNCYIEFQDVEDGYSTMFNTDNFTFLASGGAEDITSIMSPYLETAGNYTGFYVNNILFCKNSLYPEQDYLENDVPVQYYILTICTPDWYCSDFDTCNVNDTTTCLNVTDNNTCGEVFNGTLSTYDGVCDYCTPSWTCTGYEECTIDQTQDCNSVADSNTCAEPYTGNYSEFTPQSCYAPGAYESNDLGKITIDGIGTILVTILSFATIIALTLLVGFAIKTTRTKNKKR